MCKLNVPCRLFSRITIFVCILGALSWAGCSMDADPGTPSSLDTDFADNGVFRLMIAPLTNYGKAIAVTASGHIIVGGHFYQESGYATALICLDHDGRLYEPFGVLGVTTAYASGVHSIEKIVLQPDGKILVALEYVSSTNLTHDFAVMRYTLDGAPDPTFTGDGLASLDYGGEENYVTDIALQPDGKVLAVGYTRNGAGYTDFAAVRFNADGSPDDTFADHGIFVFRTTEADERVNAVSLNGDNKILLSGEMDYVTLGQCACVMRLRPNGDIDDGYGFLGLAMVEPTDLEETCEAMNLLFNGSATLFGSHGSADKEIIITRLTASGVPDTSFGSGGNITLDLGWAYERCVAGRRDAQENLVMVCNAGLGTAHRIAVVKIRNDGTPVTTFGNGGIEWTSLDDSLNAEDMALQADGSILVVGTAADRSGLTRTSIIVTRYRP